MAHFLEALLDAEASRFVLSNDRTGEILATHLEPAFDSKSRRTGFLGRDSVSPDTALIIAPGNAIHTFFMRFAIDVLFVSKTGAVRTIRRHLKPWRIAVSFGSFATIELAANALAGRDIRAGDLVVLVPRHQ
jgi:uncharacterized membrane protein (UPF0127 family)